MRVLFTNQAFANWAGSELYIRDVALELKRRGHDPLIYSSAVGELAEEVRAAGVPVVETLSGVSPAPDVIHGQHHLETLTALLRFPETPAVGLCHGIDPWQEIPLRHPRVVQYVAVSELTTEQVLNHVPIPPERVHRIPNFIDLNRFRARLPLPAIPRRALVLDNYLHEQNGLQAVRTACQEAGLELTVAGKASGSAVKQPENLLPAYDIVFGVGRSALEALAVGTAVIVLGERGFGGMVTAENVDRLRRMNFGLACLKPYDSSDVIREIRRYEAADARTASEKIRAVAGLPTAVDALIAVYGLAVDFNKQHGRDVQAEHAAIADYFQEWAPKYRIWSLAVDQEREIARLKGQLAEVENAGLAQRLLDAFRGSKPEL